MDMWNDVVDGIHDESNLAKTKNKKQGHSTGIHPFSVSLSYPAISWKYSQMDFLQIQGYNKIRST